MDKPSGCFMGRVSVVIKLLSAATIITCLVFYFEPQTDMRFSALFYDAEKGWQGKNIFFLAIYESMRAITWTLIPYLIIACWWKTPRPVWLLTRKAAAYVLLVIVLAPGIMIHWGFKEHWHRERPREMLEFGGDKPFRPVFGFQQDGRSFVSGHTGMAFSLIPLVAVSTFRRRKLAYMAVGSYATLVGFTRIVQGGHFLSDTIFAALLVLWVAALLHRIMKPVSTKAVHPVSASPE